MDDEINKIKKVFENVHMMQPATYERTGIIPARNWFVLVVLAFISILGIGIWTYILYGQINAGTLFSVPENTAGAQVTIDAQLLKKTVTSINTRAVTASQLDHATSTNVAIPQDPSL